MTLIRRITTTFVLCLLTVLVVAADKKFTLVIDPGHGGGDNGAQGQISKEKNINLSVALAFGRLVEQNCPDVKLIYTRKTDVFIPLHERANIANKNKADLFISIHTNALPKGKISRGMETYTLGMHRAGDNFDVAKRENSVILYESDYKQRYEGFNPNSSESYIMFEFLQDKNMEQSVELAKFVQKRTCASASRQDKGVKQAGFLVLRETSMPSCLIELGFISTPDEEQYLNTNQGVNSLAFGIYQAFCEYRAKYDKSVTVPFRATQYDEIPKAQKNDTKQEKGRKEQQEPAPMPEPAPASPVVGDNAAEQYVAPVFKVQILTSGRELKADSPLLKGVTDAQFYKENGVFKYTKGASEDPNEMLRLRKTLLDKFPEAFVIAFRGSEKMNVNEAIQEYKSRKANK
ncbi:MAG: N-acetylmuramoyl-L-alanine amidase [Prevotella sp.]|nr:N-acetylmuramoyl-L-alanine amidase [Prevotella sp.]